MPTHAAIVYSPCYWCDIGIHVFPMEKFRLVHERLSAEEGIEPTDVIEPEPATRDDLLLVHTPEYLRDLELLRWTPRTMLSELPLHADIVRAYSLAAGGTVRAGHEALTRGFAVNLTGGFHHAFADRAEGFCYINDLAVAVRVLQRDGRIRRAAVVDCDVHQGNGTAHIFRDDETTFTLSIHQEHNYPIPKQQSDLDIGLENGTTDADYVHVLTEALERVWEFKPDVVLYQAGADPYADDLLGGLALSIAGLEERDRCVLEGCSEHHLPVVVTLGGGYARNVADTVRIHVQTCRMALRLARGLVDRAP